MPMLDIRKDGVLVFQEMFSGALAYFYKGVSGYVYRYSGDYPVNSAAGVPTCATSSTAVPVADFEYIEDVYEAIIRYQSLGTFLYERYEDLPQWRLDVIRGQVLRMIERGGLLTGKPHPSRRLIQEKFPQYWKEAQVLSAHHLL